MDGRKVKKKTYGTQFNNSAGTGNIEF